MWGLTIRLDRRFDHSKILGKGMWGPLFVVLACFSVAFQFFQLRPVRLAAPPRIASAYLSISLTSDCFSTL